MTDSLRDWWSERTQREHILLIILAVLVAALLAWFAIWRPVNLFLDASRVSQSEALDRLSRTQSMVAEAKSVRAGPAAATDIGAVINQSAIEAGFTLTKNETRGAGQFAVAMSSAKSRALFAWLGQLERQGIFAQSVAIRSNGDGTVTFEATLRGRAA